MASYDEQLSDFLDLVLTEDPDREETVEEIKVLQSIYGPNSTRAWDATNARVTDEAQLSEQRRIEWHKGDIIRYEVLMNLESPFEHVLVRVLVTLKQSYPKESPPQLQILSRYVGDFGVDSDLFGAVLRIYYQNQGIGWTPEQGVAVFQGLEFIQNHLTRWLGEKEADKKAQQFQREANVVLESHPDTKTDASSQPSAVNATESTTGISLPPGIQIYECEPIHDRKSAFVGRACAITHPDQVPMIIEYLRSDKKIARAAHPVIHAWRCEVNGVMHQDNDDDGETAAGGRLAHLLQILDVNQVLVVVTRYFGGIHLGPDRFKHINAAARNAIELAGFLQDDLAKKKKPSRK
ncbi:eIF2 kinase Gcn2p negative regulator [Tulasnella sp. 419]|nr:eIF2 kinase Gcn2p negative regulator [Tulasnella sp. 419]